MGCFIFTMAKEAPTFISFHEKEILLGLKPKVKGFLKGYELEKREIAGHASEWEYIIPTEKKQEVFDLLYPLGDKPGFEEVMIDLHSGKQFAVKDFRLFHCLNGCGFPMIVSPEYHISGGTVIDWIRPELYKQYMGE